MSYILQALAKSEQERQLGQAPKITDTYKAEQASRKLRWPWIGLAAALLLNAALLTFLFWSPAPPQPMPEAAPIPAPAHSVMADQPQTALAPERPVGETPRVSESSAPPHDDAATAVSPPASAPLLTPDVPAPATEAMPSLADEAASVAPEEPPSLLVRSLPGIEISMHGYSKSPAERFVYINSRKYREGQRVDGQGALIERITPTGVILHQNGRSSLLQIGP